MKVEDFITVNSNNFKNEDCYYINPDLSGFTDDNKNEIFDIVIHYGKTARIRLGYTDRFPIYNEYDPHLQHIPIEELLILFEIAWMKIMKSPKRKHRIILMIRNEFISCLCTYIIQDSNILTVSISINNKDITKIEDKNNVNSISFGIRFIIETDSDFTTTEKFDEFIKNNFNTLIDVPAYENVEEERRIINFTIDCYDMYRREGKKRNI